MRAIDECTCGHHRSEHDIGHGGACYHVGAMSGDKCTCQGFFPHPQPPVPEEPPHAFQEKVWEFVRLSGHAWGTVGQKMFVELPNGETWQLDLKLLKIQTRDGV